LTGRGRADPRAWCRSVAGRSSLTVPTFDAPGVPFTLPFDINNRGQIVGYAASDLNVTEARGFLLAKGVKGRFTPVNFPGAPRTLAFGLNDRGQITGAYENPDVAPNGQPNPMRMPMMMSGG
jgi:hypothetical protein